MNVQNTCLISSSLPSPSWYTKAESMSCNGQVEYLTPPSPISPDILPKDKDPQQDTLTAFKRADGSLNAHIPHAHSSFEALPTPKPKAKPKRNNHKPRKQSRKTAHSVIERRRRDKMNAQFDVLKDMVPTCRGAEKGMHKSAILQVRKRPVLTVLSAPFFSPT